METTTLQKPVRKKERQSPAKAKRTLRKAEPYLWILPSLILMSVFIIVPIFYVFATAFGDVNKFGKIKGFAGFDNFISVLQNPEIGRVFLNTIVWTVLVVVLSTVLGFILALILNNKFRGRKIARAIVVFPWATTLVIQASVWSFIINKDYGALNTLLKTLGIIQTNIDWTPTPEAFFAWEIACGIFVTIPFVCFTVLSGLQSIDGTLYEAATVDGANYWHKLFKITLPLVKPSLTVSTVLNIIYVFNSFPIVWTITKGDPAYMTDTLVTYLYKLNFYNGRPGEAAAVSVIGFVVLLICASVYMVSTLRKGDE
ncbi:MAG: carbohydrate ABC transporter permease [Oscillospiraceae bacterium]